MGSRPSLRSPNMGEPTSDERRRGAIAAAFEPRQADLENAMAMLFGEHSSDRQVPIDLPESGLGASVALADLAPAVLGDARHLGAPGFFAHMDPPTPWVTWVAAAWSASRNQNLLHPDTAPTARELERRLVHWIAPLFGMGGGHMTPGSTVANLTAIWAAREAGATTVVASASSHLSVQKAAHLLGMSFTEVSDWSEVEGRTSDVAVVTAGTTATGEVEPLDAAPAAGWRHVDAAWAGPLRLSDQHRSVLAGIENADSVSISAHKWLFQPKESAFVLFGDANAAHRSVSFGADYLAVPNVGVLGSHGTAAVPLLATLLAYGRSGIAEWIDHTMALAEELAGLIAARPELQLRTPAQTGVVNWRHRGLDARQLQAQLPDNVFVSTTTIDGEPWLRSVAANPMAQPALVVDAVLAAAGE